MKTLDELKCTSCGAHMNLICNGAPELQDGQKLDLILECDEECGAAPLNAFVPIADFMPIN